MFEILHFRGAENILKEKNMVNDIQSTMEYLHDCLYGSFRKREIMRQALDEMQWRENGDLNILDGRRYFYKGFKNRVALDGSFSSYEYIQDALMRLQVGFDKGKIDMGVVMVNAQRSEKSPLGSTRDLVKSEIESLYQTISLPVTVVLFTLNKPGMYSEEGAQVKPGKDDKDLKDKSIKDLPDIVKPKPGITIKPVKQPDKSDKSKGKRISKNQSAIS
jgi:hypothetical protein